MAAEEENGKTLAVQTFEGVRRYGGDFNSVSVLHVSICLNETRPLPILGRMTNLVCFFLFCFSLSFSSLSIPS